MGSSQPQTQSSTTENSAPSPEQVNIEGNLFRKLILKVFLTRQMFRIEANELGFIEELDCGIIFDFIVPPRGVLVYCLQVALL